MRANVLLRWLVPAALLVVVAIVGRSWLTAPTEAPGAATARPALSDEEAEALGIAGDTPRDTVATLVGQVKAMRSELVGLQRDNRELQDANARLRHREQGIDARIDSALQGLQSSARAERQRAEDERRQAQGLLQRLQSQLDELGRADNDLPIGLGLEPDDGAAFPGAASAEVVWIEPSDRPTEQGSGSETGFRPLLSPVGGPGDSAATNDASEAPRPVYTLPENATLLGSVAMTALIGRIPVDGTVNDPYPFKVLVGRDNLTANGFELPEVVGAVMSGTATGDWTLSCVRGQVESITFVFQDGTVRTVPPPQPVTGRKQTTQAADTARIRGGLGYLSDPHGIPCIAGQRRSNAQQYLGTQSLLTAAGAGVAALLGNEGSTSTVVSSAGGGLGVSSTGGNTALHSILSGGVGDLRDWVNRLYGEAFAAIYVPPAAQVALHLDREITIDYAPTGRRVRHDAASASPDALD